MAFDDFDPKEDAPDFTTEILDDLSLHELEERIAHLESEIARCREMIGSKQGSKEEAESFFKK